MSMATRTIYSPNYYHQGWVYGKPKVVFIHATRSTIEGYPHEQELASTIDWFANPNSQASSHWIVSPQERVRMVPDEYPSWTTGFHNFEGYNIELTQPTLRTPYQPGHYRNLAIVCAPYVQQGIPIVKLDYWAYTQDQPRGFVGHEDTQQGQSLGKSDPGQMFNWDEFFRELRFQLAPEEGEVEIIVISTDGGHYCVSGGTRLYLGKAEDRHPEVPGGPWGLIHMGVPTTRVGEQGAPEDDADLFSIPDRERL